MTEPGRKDQRASQLGQQMTKAHRDQSARMTAAAESRTAPDAPPAGTTAIRTDPYRITLDLIPADYAALNRWLLSAAEKVNPEDPRRLSLASALRAMIHVTTTDSMVEDVVVDQLRHERAAKSLRHILHYVTY